MSKDNWGNIIIRLPRFTFKNNKEVLTLTKQSNNPTKRIGEQSVKLLTDSNIKKPFITEDEREDLEQYDKIILLLKKGNKFNITERIYNEKGGYKYSSLIKSIFGLIDEANDNNFNTLYKLDKKEQLKYFKEEGNALINNSKKIKNEIDMMIKTYCRLSPKQRYTYH